MIRVRGHRDLIGDSLGLVPFLLALAEKHQDEVCVVGQFCDAVKPLLAKMPIRFNDAPGDVEYNADVASVYGYCHSLRRDLHMIQGYFAMAGMEVPNLPMALDFQACEGYVVKGIIVSPFSRSDGGHNKLWYEDRWAEVIRNLREEYIGPIFVIGASGDDFLPFAEAGAIPVANYILPAILSLLRSAKLVLSIDNGISHLAHLGGVDRHVLLYPSCLSPAWVMNPRADVVHGHPSEITPAQVMKAARQVLDRSA